MTIDQPYHLHMNMTPTITMSQLVKISPSQVNSLQIHGYKYGRSTKQSRITKKLYSVTITQVSKINKSHKDNTQKLKKKINKREDPSSFELLPNHHSPSHCVSPTSLVVSLSKSSLASCSLSSPSLASIYNKSISKLKKKDSK